VRVKATPRTTPSASPKLAKAPHFIRIIGGQWRRTRLAVADKPGLRPTPDRVRETLFNWLRDDIAGARCLDLYAGTGALGFEALSRGAAEAWFVEQDPKLVAALEAQAGVFDAQPRIVRQDAASLLRGRAAQKFDVVFLDPPYTVPVEPLLALLPPWLDERALVYVGSWLKRSHAGAVEYGLLRFGSGV
jgi:16S rRNA (guanine966-N2)-methyltransferase